MNRHVRQLKKLVKGIEKLEGQLSGGFVDKAPADVVAATRATLTEKLEQRAALDASIAALK